MKTKMQSTRAASINEKYLPDDDKFGRFSFILLVILITMMGGILLAATTLIVIHVSQAKEYYKQDWERFSLKLLTEKSNFSMASKNCKKEPRGSGLAFAFNVQEEDYMEKLFSILKQEMFRGKSYQGCQGQFFIGNRKRAQEEYVTADGNYVLGPNFFPEMYLLTHPWNNELCTAISPQNDFKIFPIPCTGFKHWHCFICQHPCIDNVTEICYELWNEHEVTNRTTAIEFCQMSEKPGDLLGVCTIHDQVELKNALPDDLRGCTDKIAISNVFTMRYESDNEDVMGYISDRLNIKNNGSFRHNCIVVDEDFKWKFSSCKEESCFMCRIADESTSLLRNA